MTGWASGPCTYMHCKEVPQLSNHCPICGNVYQLHHSSTPFLTFSPYDEEAKTERRMLAMGTFGGYTRWAVVFLIIFVLFFLLVPSYGDGAAAGAAGGYAGY